MVLKRHTEAWTHPDWIWELKWDGWRTLAYIESGNVELVSRNEHVYTGFSSLCSHIGSVIRSAVLDGEIVVLDSLGLPRFYRISGGREKAVYVVFDVLSANGEDCRNLPLIERKKILRSLIPENDSRMLYSRHLDDGPGLFSEACRMDLEGVVGKHKLGPYMADTKQTTWVKVKNPNYTQSPGRHRMFAKAW